MSAKRSMPYRSSPETVETARRSIESAVESWAVSRILEFVRKGASQPFWEIPNARDIDRYVAFEERKMAALENRAHLLLIETVIPACTDYVRDRFREELQGEFPRFDSILFAPEYTSSTEREIFGWELPPLVSRYSGGCEPVYENGEAKIGLRLNFDSVFKSLEEEEEITRESFEDFVVQVLFHEVMHALSANVYLTDEGKRSAIAKWLRFLENVGEIPEYPDWSEISTRFGYSCTFVGASNGDGEPTYRSFPEINDMNEALTDIFAARAYARYRKKSWLPSKRYVFGYPLHAKALHGALAEFCRENGHDFDETFKMIERGYFFDDGDYLDAFENVLWAIVNPFSLRLQGARIWNHDENA